jgi:hypothetical protein
MEPLFRFASALLSANAPWWIVAIVALATAAPYIGPIRLNLTIATVPAGRCGVDLNQLQARICSSPK